MKDTRMTRRTAMKLTGAAAIGAAYAPNLIRAATATTSAPTTGVLVGQEAGE